MPTDIRLYRADDDWRPAFNDGNTRLYCHQIADGATDYHRIGLDELYLSDSKMPLCLNCALQRGILTPQRPTLPEPTVYRPRSASGDTHTLRLADS